MKKCLFMCVAIFMVLANVPSGFVSIQAMSPLRYSDPRFQSIEELAEWIETEDAEIFQSGRYRDCLLTIRRRGEMFFPISNDPNLVMTVIISFHRDFFNDTGNMNNTFRFGSSADPIYAIISELSPELATIYEAEGIESFFMAQRNNRVLGNYVISERIITVRDSSTGEFVERNVPYVLNYGLGSDATNANIVFVMDGIVFRIQHAHGLADELINNLTWDRVAINPAPTRPPVVIDTPPSNALNNIYIIRPPTAIDHFPTTPPTTTIPPTTPPNEVAPTSRTIRFTIGNNDYTINGITHTNDVAPFIDAAHGRTMIPLRAVIEAFDAEVEWNPTARTVQIFTDTGVHQLTIDTPLPGGMGVPVIREERVFVPLSYVAGLLGAYPRWDNANLAAYIYQDISH